jgi:ectoine hydroxylase
MAASRTLTHARELRETFERDGFVVLEGALTPEDIERYTDAVDGVWAKHRGARPRAGEPALHMLAFLGEDLRFFDLLGHSPVIDLIVNLLGANIFMYHCHLDVHPQEPDDAKRPWMWHQDGGIINRDLESDPRPRIAVKVAYFLTDVSEPGRGNFAVLPGSHLRNRIDRPSDDDNDIPRAKPVLAKPGDAVLFDRRLWHMRNRNTSGMTRRALFYAYTYRWVRPRDDMQLPADVVASLSPVQRQLLGEGTAAIDFWMPDHVDLPLEEWMASR